MKTHFCSIYELRSRTRFEGTHLEGNSLVFPSKKREKNPFLLDLGNNEGKICSQTRGCLIYIFKDTNYIGTKSKYSRSYA